jgi:hypothetical protein
MANYDKSCAACAGKGTHHTHEHKGQQAKQQQGQKYGASSEQQSKVGRYLKEEEEETEKKAHK